MLNESDTNSIDTQEESLIQKAIALTRKPRRKRPADDEQHIDMLAFASVMTILLAFFIMLSVYAGAPKEEESEEVLMSLKEAMENFGMRKIIFGSSDSITNLNFKLDNFSGKSRKENQIDPNAFANTIDKEIDIDYAQTGNQVIIPAEINFVNEKLEISPESKIYLNSLIKVIKNRDCKILVGGYTDADFVPSGDIHTSWQQSAEYASAVTKYFNDVGNIDYKRLTAVGYGKYQPLLSEELSFNTKANNRISIIVSDK